MNTSIAESKKVLGDKGFEFLAESVGADRQVSAYMFAINYPILALAWLEGMGDTVSGELKAQVMAGIQHEYASAHEVAILDHDKNIANWSGV